MWLSKEGVSFRGRRDRIPEGRNECGKLVRRWLCGERGGLGGGGAEVWDSPGKVPEAERDNNEKRRGGKREGKYPGVDSKKVKLLI